mmetsp:Transcript_3729/g.10817  ORF Transcript_3729/g.10817 Transcript_3729/m.10817 type:complete len:274 (+) Transcript_3729:375-1196(+)
MLNALGLRVLSLHKRKGPRTKPARPQVKYEHPIPAKGIQMSCFCTVAIPHAPPAIGSHVPRYELHLRTAQEPRKLVVKVFFLGSAYGLEGSLGQLLVARRELAHLLLRLLCIWGEAREGLNLELLHKVVDDVRVVEGRVNANLLRYAAEIVEEPRVMAVSHELCRHRDLSLHHVVEGDDGAIRVDPQHFFEEELVRHLVPRLVPRDACRELGKRLRPVFPAEPRYVLVGDFGCALLKGGVDDTSVGVLFALRVEAISDEILHRYLHGAHVHAP